MSNLNYRDLELAGLGMAYRVWPKTGTVRRIAATGKGREVRFVGSPTARALEKALKMGIRAGKGVNGWLDRLVSPAGMGPKEDPQ